MGAMKDREIMLRKLFENFINDDLIEDRREYSPDDLRSAYPGIGSEGARELYAMIQRHFGNDDPEYFSDARIDRLAIEYSIHLMIVRALPAAGQGWREMRYQMGLGLSSDFGISDIQDWASERKGLALSDDDARLIFAMADSILSL